jgi:ABC-2 type transport system permease protein
MPAVVNQWLFGMFTVALMMVFSVLSRSYLGVLLGTGGVIAASYAAGLVPKVAKYVPTSLMNSAKLLVGAEKASDYAVTLVITVVLTVFCIAVSIPIFNKKQI